MAINWQMANIPAPQIVGSVGGGGRGGSGSVDSLAGGLASGLNQAQQMQLNSQQMGLNQQKMEANALELGERKRQLSAADALRQASSQGRDIYLKELGNTDQALVQDFLFKEAQVKQKLAEAAGQEAKNYTELVNIAGQVAEAGLSGKTPEQQQQYWSYSRELLPEQTKKLFPEKFDPSIAMSAIHLRNLNVAKQMEAAEAKNKADSVTTTQKDLQRAAVLRTKANKGTATPEEEQELAGLQSQQVSQMRQDYLQQSKSFQAVNDAYGRIIASSINPTAAGDLSMLYSYAKMLDPLGAVREGDYNSIRNNASIPEQVRSSILKATNGEMLSAERRKQYVDRAEYLYKEQRKGYDSLNKDFSGKATRAGLNPKDVLVDFTVPGREKNIDSPNGNSGTFQEGQEYEDANGNRAIYKDGKFIPSKPMGIR